MRVVLISTLVALVKASSLLAAESIDSVLCVDAQTEYNDALSDLDQKFKNAANKLELNQLFFDPESALIDMSGYGCELNKFIKLKQISSPRPRLRPAELSKKQGNQDPTSTNDVKYAGGWVFIEKKDPFTDKNASYLYLNSEYMGRSGDDFPETLVIRCKGSGHDAYIAADGFIGGDSSKVRYRFGNKQMRSESWSLSTDGDAIFAPYTGNSVGLERLSNFIKEVRSGEDFLFELSDYRGTKSSASFDNSVHPKLDFVLNGCIEP